MADESLPAVKTGDRVLDITNIDTREIGLRLVVTGQPDGQVERTLHGMLRQINTDEWFVRDHVIGADGGEFATTVG